MSSSSCIPQADAPPERFASLEFDHFFLQPMDGPDVVAENTRLAVAYCLAHRDGG